MLPYRKSFEVVGWTFHADVYCAECGESLPETDPEGNARFPVFSDSLGEWLGWSCGGCGWECSDW
jgi:hypothetical protein